MNKKIFILMFVMILLVGTISAFEFDNVKRYNEESKVITVYNSIIFIPTTKVAEIKLLTPLNNKVPIGYQKVAEFQITAFSDYETSLKELELYNANDLSKKITRDYDYKYKTTEEFSVNDYETICNKSLNGTTICQNEISGSHLEEREVWKDFDGTLIKTDIINIGIFTDVKVGDNVEWIPNFFGIRVEEWATWTESLNVGLISYWTLNETSGTVAPDRFGNNNGEYVGNLPNAVAGVSTPLNNSQSFDGNADWIVDNDNPFRTAIDGSASFWVKPDDLSDSRVFIASGDGINATPYVYLGFGAGTGFLEFSLNTGTNNIDRTSGFEIPTNGTWYHVVITNDGSNNSFYINGILQPSSNVTGTPGLWFGDETRTDNFRIGGLNRSDNFGNYSGDIDEIALWNRSLSSAEVVQLYNEGTGITFSNAADITINAPEDNLVTFNTSLIFNATIDSKFTLKNVTLFLDEVANETNSSGLEGVDYIFNKTFALGDFNWTIEACNINDVCASSSSRNFTITKVIIQNETHNNVTLEGSTEEFSIIYDINPSFQISKTNLIYNGTSHSSTTSTFGNFLESISSITIPNFDVDVNTTFFWSFTLSDASITNSTTFTQTVNTLSLDNCSTNTNAMFNYTVWDEDDQNKLVNTSIDLQITIFDISRENEILNFSENYDKVNPAQVCLNLPLLSTTNYSLDSVVKYTANETVGNYAIEYHNLLNFTLANSTVPLNTSLFDLISEKSTDFQLTYKDEFLSVDPNILVNVLRQYVAENTFKVVEIPKTDSNGQTVLHLVRNNIVYNFIMVDSEGVVVAIFNNVIAFCQDFTIEDCKINLNARSSDDIIYNPSSDIGISFSISYSNTTEIISLDFVIDDLSAKTVLFEVLRDRGFGNRTVCEETLISASGTIDCDASAITNTDRFLFMNIFVDSSLKATQTIDLEASTSDFGIGGLFIAFILMLLLICLFMEDRQVLVVSLGIGWVTVISLGLIKGSLFGTVSAGMWLIVSIIIFLWKLKKEETG